MWVEGNVISILTGYQLFHNYIRPYMSLNGQTPADKAGIKIQGKDKWLTLIQNSVVNGKYRHNS